MVNMEIYNVVIQLTLAITFQILQCSSSTMSSVLVIELCFNKFYNKIIIKISQPAREKLIHYYRMDTTIQ